MTRTQIRRLAPGDHVFLAGMLARVSDPPLVRRRSGIRVRVAHLATPDTIVEAAPIELTAFGRLRRLSPANRALLDRLRELVRQRATR